MRILLEDLPLEAPDRLPAGRRRPVLIGALVLASVLIGAGLAIWILDLNAGGPAGPSVVRLTVALPADDELAAVPPVALSADGSMLVFVSKGQLYTRAMNSLEANLIAGTDGAVAPFFSPDGRWIGFFAQGKLKKVSVTGGSPAPQLW